ncbi:MAG TPA: DUF2125 domain-containing protein [Acetobacteraceae bacterium]
MRHRFGIGVLGLLIALVGGYSVWWYVLASQLDSGFTAWAAARRAEGWTVDVGSRHLGGWPLAARLDLSDVRLRGGAPSLPVAFTWNAAGLDLRVAPLAPTTLVILARGEQDIALQGGPALALNGGTLRARIPLARPGPPWLVDIDAEGLHAGPPQGAPALIGAMTVRATLAPQVTAAGTALSATLSAGRIELPPARPWPLGERIESIDADIAFTGPIPPSGAPEARAEAWRTAGGQATLRSGTLRWGPLDATATGTGGLDPRLQPLAEGTARVTGWARTLDVLAGHHVISDHAALTAKAVVSLLAETPPGGGPSVLTVPFTARDGILSVRGIPLLRLPALAWPRA